MNHAETRRRGENHRGTEARRKRTMGLWDNPIMGLEAAGWRREEPAPIYRRERRKRREKDHTRRHEKEVAGVGVSLN